MSDTAGNGTSFTDDIRRATEYKVFSAIGYNQSLTIGFEGHTNGIRDGLFRSTIVVTYSCDIEGISANIETDAALIRAIAEPPTEDTPHTVRNGTSFTKHYWSALMWVLTVICLVLVVAIGWATVV